jgi:hypothetical protein
LPFADKATRDQKAIFPISDDFFVLWLAAVLLFAADALVKGGDG